MGKEVYLKKDYNNIKVEKESFIDINKKINIFGSVGIIIESIINLNEIKEDSKNIENFDNLREINDKVKDKYIFN